MQEPGAENLETLLRVSAGGTRDFILPASYLDEFLELSATNPPDGLYFRHTQKDLPRDGKVHRCAGCRVCEF